MAALPYMQFYVTEYLADTAHLTTEQHGIYLLLLFNYWQRGKGFPDDIERLCGIARVSNDRSTTVQRLLNDYFQKEGDLWVHRRVEKDLHLVKRKQKAASRAGRASGNARRNKRIERPLSGRSTTVQQPLNHLDKDKDTDKEKEELKTDVPIGTLSGQPQKPAAPDGADLLGDDQKNPKAEALNGRAAKAQAVLDFMNAGLKTRYRATTPKGTLTANGKLIVDRLKDGHTVDECKAVYEARFDAWFDDDKMRQFIRPTTLFRASNFETYLGQIKQPNGGSHG